ncbi:MAG TPA: hypothetical protein VMO17_08575, partial [Terriglobia bacterium]|nr:hypothetical protein [Terriglobia bacterium]
FKSLVFALGPGGVPHRHDRAAGCRIKHTPVFMCRGHLAAKKTIRSAHRMHIGLITPSGLCLAKSNAEPGSFWRSGTLS